MRPLLVVVLASLSLLVTGCCHWCKRPDDGSGGPREPRPLRLSEAFCAANADVRWVNACLANAANDTQKGGCCLRFGQAAGTPQEQDALRGCVAYCATP